MTLILRYFTELGSIGPNYIKVVEDKGLYAIQNKKSTLKVQF